jgi:signal transduction histidine kinase
MLEAYPENPPEMEKLLAKYKGGNVPPLVARNDGKGEGLLAQELLEVFRKAFFATYGVPLYVSVISGDRLGHEQRSDQGEDLSRQKLNDLLASCKYFQSPERTDEKENTAQKIQGMDAGCWMHRAFSIQHPVSRRWLEDYMPVLQNGEVRVCMCYTGMIGLVASVHVAGEIAALLSVDCKKPKAGEIWPRELFPLIKGGSRGLSDDRRFPTTGMSSPTKKIDIWQMGKDRIQKCEEILGIEPGMLLRELTEKVGMEPDVEISPEALQALIMGMEKASEQLSDLAGKNYRLEKESIVGWLRAEMASALSTPDDFWDKIRWCFGNLAEFVGVDYILLVSRDRSHEGSLHLQCQYGLPQESLAAIQYDWDGSKTRVDDFVRGVSDVEHIQEVDLRQYRDVPVLGMLYSLYGKGVSYPVLVASTTAMDSRLTCMILGKREIVTKPQSMAQSGSAILEPSHELGVNRLREDDRQYLKTIVREMSIVTNVFSSMKKLQETVDVQTTFMESVSHDLRTPIQNIMTAAENLRECRIAPERASRTISGVVTQLQRLDLLAQKAWMLEQLRLDKLIYNDEQAVDLYSIFVECRQIMTDMAEMRSMEIHIDPSIRVWQPIHVDVEMLRLVVLNLLHNGIKYSFPNTHVRIGGWQNGIGIGAAMTFENEGIPIQNEEKDRIFERYFRSNNAVKMSPDGSGIGLALVKEFVDHYRGKIDVRSTEVGFGRYLNVFSIFLPGR